MMLKTFAHLGFLPHHQATASFLQLFLTALFKLQSLSFPPKSLSAPKIWTRTRASIESLLLWPSDIPVALAYVIAFICLSDLVVPTGILLGYRDGTTCYTNNLDDRYAPLILRFCVLGQHGYWWSMCAM